MIYNESKLNRHWPIHTLAELGDFKRGKSRHRPRNDVRLFEAGKYPLIQTGEIKEANLFIHNHSASYSEFGLAQSELWAQGTLCITIAANIAETAILGYPMCFPDSVVGFIADKRVSSEVYMHYVFSFIRKAIQNSASGSIQDNINIEYLTALRLRIPPKPTQDQIATVLSALDSKIELNQRLNAELEGLAKLLYDYWFVQYDFPISPAQAKALGKPSLAGKPYRSSGGPMVFHPQLKREVPMGWRVGTLDDLCHLNAHTWGKSNQPERVSYVDLANTKNGEISSVQYYQWDDAPSRARRILTPGDTIFGTVRPGNRSFALVPPTDFVLTGSTGFAVLTPRSDIYREFNYLSVISESNIDRLTTVASGAAYPAVNPEVVTAQVLPIPPEEPVKHFHDSVASSFDLIATYRTQSHHLAQLRDWLLPMLMNGQVTVGKS